MKIIYKYQLNPDAYGRSKTVMPKDAKIIDFQVINNIPYVWCIVDTDMVAKVEYDLYIFPTGKEIIMQSYIRTCHAPPFVWHLFENKGQHKPL